MAWDGIDGAAPGRTRGQGKVKCQVKQLVPSIADQLTTASAPLSVGRVRRFGTSHRARVQPMNGELSIDRSISAARMSLDCSEVRWSMTTPHWGADRSA